jgi:hypothetical protein
MRADALELLAPKHRDGTSFFGNRLLAPFSRDNNFLLSARRRRRRPGKRSVQQRKA